MNIEIIGSDFGPTVLIDGQKCNSIGEPYTLDDVQDHLTKDANIDFDEDTFITYSNDEIGDVIELCALTGLNVWEQESWTIE